MSYLADKLKGGWWPLQHLTHKDDGFAVGDRIVRFALRIAGRLDGQQEVGHWLVEPDTAGDVLGGLLWPVEKAAQVVSTGGGVGGAPGGGARGGRFPVGIFGGSVSSKIVPPRGVPAWAFAWPTTIQDVFIPAGHESCDPAAKPIEAFALPIVDRGFEPDERFEAVQVAVPATARIPFVGSVGVTLCATEETEQRELFFPCDDRLVAVNRAGNPACASVVYDLRGDNSLDAAAGARLHTAWRVVRPRPPGKVSWDKHCNSLAWQLGRSGRDDLAGLGLVRGPSGPGLQPLGTQSLDVDDPNIDETGASVTIVVPPPQRTVAAVPGIVAVCALEGAGFIDPGEAKDPHSLGQTADGEPINSAHIATTALFRGGVGDAPLAFEPVRYSRPPRMPFRAPVHLRLDPDKKHDWLGEEKEGLWRWEAEVPVFIPTRNPPTTVPPPPTLKRPPPVIVTPRPEPGLPVVTTRPATDASELFVQATMLRAGPGFLVRPQDGAFGAPDLRRLRTPSLPLLDSFLSHFPIVGRAEGFTRLTLPLGGAPIYTQGPGLRFDGGTACGGQFLIVPERDIIDVLYEGSIPIPLSLTIFDPANPFITPTEAELVSRGLSCFTFGHAPGTIEGWGVPSQRSGRLRHGLEWKQNGAGDLVLDLVQDGVVRESVLRVDWGSGILHFAGGMMASGGDGTFSGFVAGGPPAVSGPAPNEPPGGPATAAGGGFTTFGGGP